MIFLLDTNICVYLIMKRPREVLRRFDEHAVGDIGISSITAAQLYFGVQKSQHAAQNRQALERFLLPLTVVEFGHTAAAVYGRVRASLERGGTPIGSLDTLIAAHALGLGLTLVTNNEREFTRVPDLAIENWASP